MRKQFLYLCLALVVGQTINAQTRGTKLGYIDMEYILQNVPDYTEAKAQLEQKAEKWKLEIDTKKIEINKLKEALKAERALLMKEKQKLIFLKTKIWITNKKDLVPTEI
jgi:Skp family chaperone for outer membrane proteins